MISSLVGSPSGFSTTTSQCSKSQPSSKIVSLGGRFDQLGFGSLSDDDVARVANPLNGAAEETRRRTTPAAARGRRREREEIAEREEAAALEVAKERERKEARVRVLGRERERECIAMAVAQRIKDRIPEKRKNPREKGVQVDETRVLAFWGGFICSGIFGRWEMPLGFGENGINIFPTFLVFLLSE
jgi:hypothetical protein